MGKKARLLYVEDDLSLSFVTRDNLEMKGYAVDFCEDGVKALEMIHSAPYDLCILDVMLPYMDGFELAKEITKINPDIPFVFLTSKTLKEDILEGYKLGAFDYITKPFDTEIFLFKIKAIFKAQHHFENVKIEEQQDFSIGRYLFKYKLREVYDGEKIYNLSPKEAELLRMLFIHRDNLLTRQLALKTIWGDDNYFTTRSMDVYITKLRKLFKDDDNIEIMNLHGNGFRLLERK